MNAFKSQQFRWAKGSIQVGQEAAADDLAQQDVPLQRQARGVLPPDEQLRLSAACCSCRCCCCRTCSCARATAGARCCCIDLPLFFGTTLSIATFYITSQREIGATGSRRCKRLPLMMSLGIGLCINQTRAVLEALFGGDVGRVRPHAQARRGAQLRGLDGEALPRGQDAHPVRRGAASRSTSRSRRCWRSHAGHYVSLPFLLLFCVGFGYVGVFSLRQSR